MRIGPHHHPCSRCGTKTECCGQIEQNYDGFPEWICREFHTLAHREFTPVDHFLCEMCAAIVEQEQETEEERVVE